MRRAVDAGYWTLYRRHPERGLAIDSRPPTASYEEFIKSETRYRALEKSDPETAKKLFEAAECYARRQREKLEKLMEAQRPQ